MSQFIDKQGQSWTVSLDAPIVQEIESRHQVQLANLEKDPLQKLRNEPLILAAVLFLICEEQIQAKNLTPVEFGKLLPYPPDSMLEAVKEAIVDFFPAGRASHVLAVLTKYEEMSAKTDELAVQKMKEVLNDPKTASRLSRKADQLFQEAMTEMFPLDSEPGT